MLGTKGTVAPVDITGTLAYIGKGNTWIVRESTAERRPLTTDGDLDGRMFDLSPDGKYLLFSRSVGHPVGAIHESPLQDSPELNTLWIIDTVPFNAEPRQIPIKNALYAQWAPDGSSHVAYTAGEKTQGAPGWKAYNDLNIATFYGITETLQVGDTNIQTQTVRVTPVPLPSDTPPPPQRSTQTSHRTRMCRRRSRSRHTPPRPFGRPLYPHDLHYQYAGDDDFAEPQKRPSPRQIKCSLRPECLRHISWWGWNLAWSPDAKSFAYALTDQVGLVPAQVGESGSASRKALQEFAYYNTRGDWVWVPQFAWSPDGRFVAATGHAPPNGAERGEDATGFDLWLLSRDASLSVPIRAQYRHVGVSGVVTA